MLFIFDWDGTLMDSTDKIVRCMRKSIQSAGLASKEDHELKEIIGLGLPEAFQQLFPGSSDGLVNDLRKSYSEHFIDADQTPCDFYPQVMETLTVLKERGHYIAVATGKSRRGLNRVLDNLSLEDFFHSSRCADETRSKPHPLMLEELLDEFSLQAGDAVMIGDTEFDMEMAQQASVPRVAVSYGAHHIDRLKAYSPILCADRIDQLLSID